MIPSGLLVTVPCPLPVFVTEIPKLFKVTVALTDFAAFIVTVQVVMLPLQPPDQPLKFEFPSGLAVRVTDVLIS